MNPNRVIYRINQFWHALWERPDQADIELARKVLTPEQMVLFSQMPAYEQAHSLRVFNQVSAIQTWGNSAAMQDLVVAALLHDVGKIRLPLRIWERILIVLARGLFPSRAERWGQEEDSIHSLPIWKRPFVIAQQHPKWGAEMAAQVGATPFTVALIRRHQNRIMGEPVNKEEQYLQILQSVDHDS